MALLVGGVDVVLHCSCLCSSKESTLVLYLQEQFPCGISERVGKFLDEVRTGRGVNHLVEVTLLLEQELLVACDTLREIRRLLIGSVERTHHDRVNTSEGGTHGLCLRAEQVDIAVEHSHIIERGGGIHAHLACTIALGLILLNNLCPEQTCSTELGNLHEVVLRDTHVKLDSLGSLGSIHTSLGELSEIFITPSQGITQFLHDISTGIVEVSRVDSHHAILGIILQGIDDSRSLGDDSLGVLTLHHDAVDGVEVDASHELLLVITLLVEVGGKDLSQFNRLAVACREVEFDALTLNT